MSKWKSIGTGQRNDRCGTAELVKQFEEVLVCLPLFLLWQFCCCSSGRSQSLPKRKK